MAFKCMKRMLWASMNMKEAVMMEEDEKKESNSILP